jgi:hypothetical protein
MRDDLLKRIEGLAVRLSHLGVTPDLAALPLADLWGLYRYLKRLADGST